MYTSLADREPNVDGGKVIWRQRRIDQLPSYVRLVRFDVSKVTRYVASKVHVIVVGWTLLVEVGPHRVTRSWSCLESVLLPLKPMLSDV